MRADALLTRATRGGLLQASLLALVAATLAACAGGPRPQAIGTGGEPSPKYTGYKVGQPYQVKGVWYYPKDQPSYEEIGIASWYGEQFHNHYTADGEIFDMGMPSAAHKTLPLPSLVEVTNLANGRTVIVRVNDRGPFVDGRVIDMSKAAAEELGFVAAGITRVRVRYVGRAEDPPGTRQYQADNSQQPPKPSVKLPTPKLQFAKAPSFLTPPPLSAPPVIAPPVVTPPNLFVTAARAREHGGGPLIAVPPTPPTQIAANTLPTQPSSLSAPAATPPATGYLTGPATAAGPLVGTVSQTALSPLVGQTTPSYVAASSTPTTTATSATAGGTSTTATTAAISTTATTAAAAPTTAAAAARAAPVDEVTALLSDAAPAASVASATGGSALPIGGSYELQAGVFAVRANAEALAARLNSMGSPQIVPLQRAGQTLYRVVVHGFANPTAAAAARSQAAALGVPDARVIAAGS